MEDAIAGDLLNRPEKQKTTPLPRDGFPFFGVPEHTEF
jgi:hypothetical protein